MPKQPYIERMRRLLGDALPDYLAALDAPPSRALHTNRFKEVAALAEGLGIPLTPISYAEDGFYLESEEKLGRHPLHHAGAIYLQEPSAMMPVSRAGISPGMHVLDLCASPGGKSSQIANRLAGEGLLVSNEIVPSRAATLASNIERLGIPNAIVTCTDAKHIASAMPGFFDVVVADVPCSGEGMFRKLKEAREEWNEGMPAGCAERGLAIVEDVLPALKPGGRLIYSTCTHSTEENEEVVIKLLKTHPELTLEPQPSEIIAVTASGYRPLCPDEIDPERMRRFYPHIARGEGQFFACLRKSESAALPPPKKGKRGGGEGKEKSTPSKEELSSYLAFCRENLSREPRGELVLHGGILSLTREKIPLDPAHIVTYGVRLGTSAKGRFVPHHALVSAFGGFFRRQLALSVNDPRTLAYLHGETIPAESANGWCAVLVEGVPLGLAKVTDRIAKNHYPKGLRNPN